MGHLGNEDMWHVPLVMDWHRLDASLVRDGQYPGPPGAARPTWAHKLLLYRTSANGGVAEKRGYFVVPRCDPNPNPGPNPDPNPDPNPNQPPPPPPSHQQMAPDQPGMPSWQRQPISPRDFAMFSWGGPGGLWGMCRGKDTRFGEERRELQKARTD